MNKVLGNKKAISLFVVPALIVYTIIVMVPVIWSLYYSFFSGSPGLQWEFAGFDNYARLFRDKNFLNALTVNCKYVLVVTVGQVGMGLLLSLMFKFWLRRCKTIVRTLVFFPVVLPTVAVGQLFAKIYEIQPNYGLLNSLLDSLGFTNLVQPWIGQSSTAGFENIIGKHGGIPHLQGDGAGNSYDCFRHCESHLFRLISIFKNEIRRTCFCKIYAYLKAVIGFWSNACNLCHR